ncbi:hypothetical protein HOY80DRAFT_960951 [Tuber brumale]|nr:hypothetical protein HOY80DRAFT_960951 [Tuber brumale]
MLLGRQDVNPNAPDDDGQTPLYSAAWNGHEGAVKILLGRPDVCWKSLENPQVLVSMLIVHPTFSEPVRKRQRGFRSNNHNHRTHSLSPGGNKTPRHQTTAKSGV